MTGHVHVVAGDLKSLHCDGWLLPTDDEFRISRSFNDVAGVEADACIEGLRWEEGERVRALPGTQSPLVWLGRIGAAGENAKWYASCVPPFVAMAAARQSRKDGRRPLFAVNVLGTGDGGMSAEKGAVHEALLPALYAAAHEHDVDLALVCWTRRSYSAAQRVRRRMAEAGQGAVPGPTWDMGNRRAELVEQATALGEQAVARNLVLFLGAGLSAAVGMPLWQALLDRIAEKVGVTGAALDGLHRLDVRDQAAVLQRRLKSRQALHDAVKAALDATRYSLGHAHLASLPTTEAVTTNYDQLFEVAARAVDREVAVLPYEPAEPGVRWLLKLHGSIDREDSIVLTRSDYLGVPARHGALFGLVQAMLLTRHMLFVGYSLTDDDFHQLVDEVRQARGTDAGKIGTAITLFDDDLFSDLWSDDVHIVAMQDAPVGVPSPAQLASASRTLHIFLDLIAFEASDLDAFLLDPDYSDLLSGEERELADRLRELTDGLSAVPATLRIHRLLQELGFTTRGDVENDG